MICFHLTNSAILKRVFRECYEILRAAIIATVLPVSVFLSSIHALNESIIALVLNAKGNHTASYFLLLSRIFCWNIGKTLANDVFNQKEYY